MNFDATLDLPAGGSTVAAATRESRRLMLQDVSKRYGAVTALEPMSLEVQPGELLALLGPSGCGKTTTLRIIAGFEQPDSGSVVIGEQDISRLPPNRRGLGMLFQNYSLFPHLTVGENIAYGLRMAGSNKRDAAPRVEQMLELIRLPGFAQRRIAQLSGGQQQRVALARALVTSPAVLLLDEPLGALDKNLREGMQFELRQLQRQFGITSVMVTHDQEEALTMSDRVVVMNKGRILQIGAPREVYDYPRTRFVAEFLGTANILSGKVAAFFGKDVKLLIGDSANHSPSELVVNARGASREALVVAVALRPEKVVLDAPLPHHLRLEGRIAQHVFRGTHHAYLVDVEALGRNLIAYQLANSRFGGGEYNVGAPVVVSFDPANAVLLERDAPGDAPIADPSRRGV